MNYIIVKNKVPEIMRNKGYTKPNYMKQDIHTESPYQKANTDAKMDKITKMLELLNKNHSNLVKGMMIQSDQGTQYQNSQYQTKLEELGIIQSMSRKENCLDNSPTENLFDRMKNEMWYGHE